MVATVALLFKDKICIFSATLLKEKISFMNPPQEIATLVERFERNRDAYLSGDYNEMQLRREFIDPLFAVLGWDVENKQGFAEAYKDVIHEDAIKIGGATKAPDYCFRIGGGRKFFVEAKKPSINLKDDVSPAFQLRRYAWSAKLPLSILTNFAEFAVYDCRLKPSQSDKPAVGRTAYFTYQDYATRWGEISNIFSKDAVLKGAFDKYAETNKTRKGTAEVDTAFLKEIEAWRELFAKSIAQRNPALSQRELNFAVQRTIDRIIFLRICEDRGIEIYGALMALLNGERVYPRLCELFHRADERYNSDLFHFQPERNRQEAPDDLTLHLQIDDKPLKEIIRNLYYPDSPYEFSVLPADILGQVYEQFLGKVIRLTSGHRAVVEDKPEVKKAGGVYYTPTYIVDYIVKNTVGKLFEGKTPKQAARLRILDPACGSGSFLIGAYQYLLDWHRDWYVNDGPKKHVAGRQPSLYQVGKNDWRLTTSERKRILLNNIFGVDIDPQAVEVTRLSLLLKVLEGESEQTISRQLRFFHERALPDLGNNIKYGNSLIGPDFYEQQMNLLDDEERYRLNVFDWRAEFSEIMKAGGFDAVIGNPPYIRIQTLKEWAPIEVEVYKQTYKAAGFGNYDIYVVFVEKGLALLSKNGRLGFILPNKFFNARYGEPLRSLIAEGKHLAHVVHFGDQQIFAGATTYTCLLFLDKEGSNKCRFVKVDDLSTWRIDGEAVEGNIPAKNVTSAEWNFTVGNGVKLLKRLSDWPVKLAAVVDRMYQGPITSADTVFLFKEFQMSKKKNTIRLFSQELKEWVTLESRILKNVIRSGSIGRYWAKPSALVLFPYEILKGSARLFSQDEMKQMFPLAWEYLCRNKKILEGREKGKFQGAQWYRFGRTQNLGIWEQSKLMIPYMITELAAFLDRSNNYYFINVTTGGYGIISDELNGSLEYLCGLLNSRLLNFYLKHVSTNFHGGYFAANKQYIEKLPIRPINFSDLADKSRHDRMVELVERMIASHKRLAAAKLDHEKTLLQRQIDATDRQIDVLVYELYGLTEEEIRIVEAL